MWTVSDWTPGPWRVALGESEHWAESPSCTPTEVVLRVRHASSEEIVRRASDDWGDEFHVLATEIVEDVVGPGGRHIVCFGHDYDERGFVDLANARLIAAAPEMHALIEEVAGDRYACCADMYHTGPCLHEQARQLLERLTAHTEESDR